MKGSKLIELLSKLTYKELKDVSKLLESSFFSTNQAVRDLGEYLIGLYPNFDTKNLEKVTVFNHIYPDKKYDDLLLRHTISDLYESIEQLIVLKKILRNKLNYNNVLLRKYTDLGMEKHFNTALGRNKQLLKGGVLEDVDLYLHNYHFQQEILNNLSQKNVRSEYPNLKLASENLDLFYLISKLKITCGFLKYKQVFKSDEGHPFVDEIIQRIQDRRYDHIPLVQIYYSIYKILTKKEADEDFEALTQLLKKHALSLTQREAKELYTFALNFCNQKINEGKTNYLSKLFNLYKDLLASKVIFDRKRLSPLDYKNIISVGLRVNEPKWTEDFIRKYIKTLDAPYRKNALNFNQAKLHFHKKDYTKTLKLLGKVTHDNLSYVPDCRCLEIQTFYELNEIIPLRYTIVRLESYIKKNKDISQENKHSYKNMTTTIKMLANLKDNTHKTLEDLLKKVNNTENIANREWLVAKIHERFQTD